MNKRKKYLLVLGGFYFLIYLVLYFGLKDYSNKNFNKNKLSEMLNGSPRLMVKTTDLCTVKLLGEPKVGLNYVKINFYCENGKNSMNTLSLDAFEDKTVLGIIDEYGRIVNFDGKFSLSNLWSCKLNSETILANKNGLNIIQPASTIDCYQKK